MPQLHPLKTRRQVSVLNPQSVAHPRASIRRIKGRWIDRKMSRTRSNAPPDTPSAPPPSASRTLHCHGTRRSASETHPSRYESHPQWVSVNQFTGTGANVKSSLPSFTSHTCTFPVLLPDSMRVPDASIATLKTGASTFGKTESLPRSDNR